MSRKVISEKLADFTGEFEEIARQIDFSQGP